MRYLLDTNALIGLLFQPELLSPDACKIILKSDQLYVSIISFWEIGIKQAIGKIDIEASAVDIENACKDLKISLLPLKCNYIDAMKILPLIHRDPFDRIIIAQAIVEDMILITKDKTIPLYKEVKTLW